MDYEIQKNEDGEVLECDNCGAEVETMAFDFKEYEMWHRKAAQHNFCEICSSTFFSRATTNLSSLTSAEIWLFKSTAKALNIIRQEIRANGKKV